MIGKKEKEILERFVSGEANETEISWVEENFNSDKLKPFLKSRLKEEWKSFNEYEEVQLEHILDKINHILRSKDYKRKKSFISQAFNIYLKIAAVLLIPVLLSGIYFYIKPANNKIAIVEDNTSSTITAPLGSRVAFNLPDGSKGYLNSGSSLSYSLPFQKDRKVKLEGEAWFDVTKDKKHPFEVSSGLSVIKVLGTSFNVSAFKDTEYIEVVLESGSIEFQPNKNTKPVLLEPSEKLMLQNNSIFIEKTDPAKYKGWTEGKLIFRGDNMVEVAKRLERWYNIKVEIVDKELETYVFRGTFIDDSLNKVLQYLSISSPIEYTITPRHRVNDEIWEKEKVTLTKRN